MFNASDIKRPAVLRPLTVILAWTAYGVFFASQSILRQMFYGRQTNWVGNLVSWLVCGYTWAFLTPLVWSILRRAPISKQNWRVTAPIVVLTGLILSFIQLALYLIVIHFAAGLDLAGYAARYRGLVIEEYHASFLVYLAIVGVFYFRRAWAARHAKSGGPIERGYTSGAGLGEMRVNGNAPVTSSKFVSRVPVKLNGRIVLVDIVDIIHINSEGNYVKLHTRSHRYMVRETMNAMERKLDPAEFVRIRRSAIVRLDQIAELHPLANGEFEIALKDGSRLAGARRYRKNLETVLRF